MTNKTSVTRTRTIPKTPRGKKAVSVRPNLHGATPANTATAIPISDLTAEPLTNGPTTDARRAQDLAGQTQDGQKQVEVNVTGGAPATKLSHLLDLLRRPEGTTLADMCAATGGQAHSVCRAMAGVLKRKGHVIASEKLGDARRDQIEVAS